MQPLKSVNRDKSLAKLGKLLSKIIRWIMAECREYANAHGYYVN